MIATYADLKAAVADEFLNTQLAGRIDLFMVSVQAEIARWVRQAGDLPPLVADGDTNDVLVQFPDVYRFGLLARGFQFGRDYQASQIYETLFQAALGQLAMSPLALPYGLRPVPGTLIRDGRRRTRRPHLSDDASSTCTCASGTPCLCRDPHHSP